MPSVLIVDDQTSIHEMLDAVIQPTGFTTAFASDGTEALERYKATKFDMVLADIDMTPMDGITLLQHLKEYDPDSVTVIMTAYASTESAVQALKFGAFDYLQKPFRVDELIATMRRSMEYRALQTQRAHALVAASVGSPADLEARLVGQGPKMLKVIQQVRKLGAVRSPALLIGESGTGKTTIAEYLHAVSAAEGAQLVRIDCSLSSDQGFVEGLLGVNGEGGAWIQNARGGTLLLQQLQALPLEVQKKLVSVLRSTASGFRLICTANEDLEKMMDEGRFDDELFYRVASLPLALPPLRDRREDIPLLVQHFTNAAASPLLDASQIEFTDDAIGVMTAYHWPGNLTELNQVVTKIVSTTESRVVTSEQLPLRLHELEHWPTLAEFWAGQARQYIDRVLHACQGDKAMAAKVLDVDEATLG